MRLLVIEDHGVFRECLVACLHREFPTLEFGEAKSYRDAMRLMEDPWDLALLDLGLPDGDGFDLLDHAKRRLPALKVLVLTASTEEECGVLALRHGAHGFLVKSGTFSDTADAIRSLAEGRRYFSLALAQHICSLGGDRYPTSSELSAREIDIVRLTADGLSGPQIGRELNVSEKMVKTYRGRIYQKLNLRGVAALVRFAIAHQLAAVPDQRSL